MLNLILLLPSDGSRPLTSASTGRASPCPARFDLLVTTRKMEIEFTLIRAPVKRNVVIVLFLRG